LIFHRGKQGKFIKNIAIFAALYPWFCAARQQIHHRPGPVFADFWLRLGLKHMWIKLIG